MQDAGLDISLREPVGVCALIVPWNFPLAIASWKIAPGARVREHDRRQARVVTRRSRSYARRPPRRGGPARRTRERPPGPGVDRVGRALVGDPRVSKVGFTGSTAVGAQMMKRCADNITRVSLELGGKSANVVFADADIDVCVERSMWSVFDNTGQDCSSRARMFVQRPVYDEFIERLAKRTERASRRRAAGRVHRPRADDLEGQRQTSLDYISLGVDEGARLVDRRRGPGRACGRVLPAPRDPRRRRQPWRVAQEEIFGPVACLMPFDDGGRGDPPRERHRPTVCRGRSGPSDLGRAIRVAKGIRTGVLSRELRRTASTRRRRSAATRQSGIGREMGMHAVNLYTEVKNIFFAE